MASSTLPRSLAISTVTENPTRRSRSRGVVDDDGAENRRIGNGDINGVARLQDGGEQPDLLHRAGLALTSTNWPTRKGRRISSITPAATFDNVPCIARPMARPAAPITAIRLVV